jgi:O-acetyl-ADP-ribose deacetylase (regulator of RNase III)
MTNNELLRNNSHADQETRMKPWLDIEDYRYRIRLDEILPVPEPAPEDEASRGALVDQVLDYLLSEKPGAWSSEEGSTRATYESKRRMVRALLTVRPPDPLPSWFHEAIGRLLQRESRERGTVEAMEMPRIAKAIPGTTNAVADRCALWRGDITALRVDAVVNAANSALLGCFQPFHACIDNAIQSAAGPRVREDCHAIMKLQGAPEETGRAKITRAYNLPAKYILHTVGPIFRGEVSRVLPEQEMQLSACYRSCLELALRVPGIRSVAFCCISTGVFGFPVESAGRIALRTVEDFLKRHPGSLDLVVFNVFSDEDFQIYKRLLRIPPTPL